ncbi:MAG: hypothetical protein V9H26_00205 [Verrucomicrobiota bacterium]
MTGLYNWKGSTYAWNNGGLNGALDIHDNGITGETIWDRLILLPGHRRPATISGIRQTAMSMLLCGHGVVS